KTFRRKDRFKRAGPILCAPRRDANGNDGWKCFRNFINLAEHGWNVFNSCLELDNGGEDLFVENVVAQLARLHIRHEMGDRILRLEFDSDAGESVRHLLDISEANADRRPAKFHYVAYLTDADAPGHVVCFHFFGTAAVDSRTLVRHERITECAAHDA